MAAVCLLSAIGLLSCDAAPRAEPSIVVVTIDTLRADHLSAYGYFRETSPVLDALAVRAVLFENAVTTIGTTLPSHVALWTARYPYQTGVTGQGRRLMRKSGSGDRVRFFSQMLRQSGYSTAAFVSATPVKVRTGLGAGFDVFDQPEGGGRPARATTDAALEWLASRPPGPFFLWLHYFDPHKPYEPPEPYDVFETEPDLLDFLHARGLEDPISEKVLQGNNGYDGEILYVDAQVGRVIEVLESEGGFRDLAMVVTSDHGEALGQHGKMGHGWIYNEQLFVPLIVKFPEAEGLGGRRVGRLVSLIDVVPTLVARLALPVSEADRRRFTGIDALDDATAREFVLAQQSTIRKRKKLALRGTQRESFGLLSLDWKYVIHDLEGPRLFDLRNDPHELRNLAGERPDKAEEMEQRLLRMLAAFRREEPDFEVVDESLPKILDELRAHGYLE